MTLQNDPLLWSQEGTLYWLSCFTKPLIRRRSLYKSGVTFPFAAFGLIASLAASGAVGQTFIDNGQQVIVPDTQASPWNTGFLLVGNNGTGSLIIHQAGIVNSDFSGIGVATGGNGTVTLTDPGSEWNVSDLSVGDSGTGNLTVSSGAILTSQGNITIGNAPGGIGAVTVVGPGSELHSNNTILGGFAVGHFGIGSLTIADGGLVTSDLASIGSQSSGEGAVTVTGAGSRWDNDRDLIVGENGIGSLEITDAGVVTSELGRIGNAAGSVGSVTVRGPGSQWNNLGPGGLAVGFLGRGALNISGGGVVSSGLGRIGNSVGSEGVVTVSGVGSQWNNS
ncbi:hypothetical protein LH464_24050, partial [Neorhizobium sp. T786]|nr:hypothetical protein [Neorhizobium xiangyangii]